MQQVKRVIQAWMLDREEEFGHRCILSSRVRGISATDPDAGRVAVLLNIGQKGVSQFGA